MTHVTGTKMSPRNHVRKVTLWSPADHAAAAAGGQYILSHVF